MKMLINMGMGYLGKEFLALRMVYDTFKKYKRKRRKANRIKKFMKWIIKNPIKFGLIILVVYVKAKGII